MKPIRTSLILGCLLSCVTAYAAPQAGDVDNSSVVNAIDVQLVINAALGAGPGAGANLDYAGGINAIDVQLVINAALGLDIDTDDDGLSDAAESNLETNPALVDTDGDATGDGQEMVDGTDPLDAGAVPDLGLNANLHGKRPFAADDEWNRSVLSDSEDPNSDAIIDFIGRTKTLKLDLGTTEEFYGIPYTVVSGSQAKVPIAYYDPAGEEESYGDESDPGPFPIPLNAPIEGGSTAHPDPPSGDRHVLVIDRDNWVLYELYHATRTGAGFTVSASAKYDLTAKNVMRPAGWTSADGAGMPIFPGLARYDEVANGAVRHALRFTVRRVRRAYTYPGNHLVGGYSDSNLLAMGQRVRMKASFNISGYSPAAQTLMRAMKRHGLIVADIGTDWYITGVSNPAWADVLDEIRTVSGDAFEALKPTFPVVEGK